MITFQLVYSIHHKKTGGNFIDESTGQTAIRGRQYPVVYCKIYNGIQEMIENGTVISLNTRTCILTFFLAKKYKLKYILISFICYQMFTLARRWY